MDKIRLWQGTESAVCAASGFLLHFSYEWSGKSPVAAVFSAVNESVWEHMKLLFVPLFVFALVQSRFFRQNDFWSVKLIGTALGVLFIPALYYTVNGAFGDSPGWFHIVLFFLAVAAACLTEAALFRRGKRFRLPGAFSFGILCTVALAFAVFTFYPPVLPLFTAK